MLVLGVKLKIAGSWKAEGGAVVEVGVAVVSAVVKVGFEVREISLTLLALMTTCPKN